MHPIDSLLFILYSAVLTALVQSTPLALARAKAIVSSESIPANTDSWPFTKSYSDFQISDGFGGSAEEEAAEVFINSFDEVDLASVPFEVYDKLKLAEEAVEDAEIELFEPAIARVGKDTWAGRALKVGLLKNRVLFATAAVQAHKIEAAHNRAMNVDNAFGESELEFAEEYLAWTIEADNENDREPSLGVT